MKLRVGAWGFPGRPHSERSWFTLERRGDGPAVMAGDEAAAFNALGERGWLQSGVLVDVFLLVDAQAEATALEPRRHVASCRYAVCLRPTLMPLLS